MVASLELVDAWIQLKSSPRAWTFKRLLREGVVTTFLVNALWSEAKGRTWSTEFVSPGPARRATLMSEISSLEAGKPSDPLAGQLSKVAKVAAELEFPGGADHLNRLACALLTQLSEVKPVTTSDLHVRLIRSAERRSVDVDTADGAVNLLIGTMLSSSAASTIGPATCIYNADWVAETVPYLSRDAGQLLTDPVAACLNASATWLPPGASRGAGVVRVAAEEDFRKFLVSEQTVFCVVGPTGSGKTWIAHRWARSTERLAVFIPWRQASVGGAGVGEILRRALLQPSGPIWEPDRFRLWFANTSTNTFGKKPLLILDDVVPTGEPDETRAWLAQLAVECATTGIQLVLTSQDQLWGALTNLAPRFRIDSFSKGLSEDHLRSAPHGSARPTTSTTTRVSSFQPFRGKRSSSTPSSIRNPGVRFGHSLLEGLDHNCGCHSYSPATLRPSSGMRAKVRARLTQRPTGFWMPDSITSFSLSRVILVAYLPTFDFTSRELSRTGTLGMTRFCSLEAYEIVR